MTKRRSKPSSQSWIVSTALTWAIPMSIFFCGVLWKDDGLTIGTALGVILLAIAVGFGFAVALREHVRRKYGGFKDE
jgi:ABC-type Fe3+ transport system permease subunit